MDMIGPIEARLLGLERKLAVVDRNLANNRRALVAVQQGIWDAWSDWNVLPQSSEPTEGVTAFPDVCPLLPITMTVIDSYYGAVPITWDGVSTWKGCRQVSYPGTSICKKASTPIFFTLFGDDTNPYWTLLFRWVAVASGCPQDGATCTSRPNRGFKDNVQFNCKGTTTWGVPAGPIYPVSGIPHWSITLP